MKKEESIEKAEKRKRQIKGLRKQKEKQYKIGKKDKKISKPVKEKKI